MLYNFELTAIGGQMNQRFRKDVFLQKNLMY